MLIRRVGTGGPVVAGLAFAVAWLPCTGPTLGAILTAAANEDTVGEGGFLLAFYALGLAVPFLLSAVAFTQVTSVFRFVRNHYSVITAVGGTILIVMGFLLYTNELTEMNAWLNRNGVNAISDLLGAAHSAPADVRLHRVGRLDAEQVEAPRDDALRLQRERQPEALLRRPTTLQSR